MSAATRAWLAFPAVGAGIIHLALALAAPLPFAAILALFGFVKFFWGVLTFAGQRVPVPRIALGVALVPTIAWGLSVALGITPALSLVAMAGACVLELIVVVTLARHLRDATAAPRTGFASVVAAVVVVAVVAGGSLAVASDYVELPGTPPQHGH